MKQLLVVSLFALFNLVLMPVASGSQAYEPARECFWDLQGRWEVKTTVKEQMGGDGIKGPESLYVDLGTRQSSADRDVYTGVARSNSESGVACLIAYPSQNGKQSVHITVDWNRPETWATGLGSDGPVQPCSFYEDSYPGLVDRTGFVSGSFIRSQRLAPNAPPHARPKENGFWELTAKATCRAKPSRQDAVTKPPGGFAPSETPKNIPTEPKVGSSDAGGVPPPLELPHGRIGEKYAAVGGPNGPLGKPLAGEADAPYGGRFQTFAHGYIYWHPSIGEAFIVWGDIARKWDEFRRVEYGYPVTDERTTPDGRGRFNHFRALHLDGNPESSIYWTPQTGAHAVYGRIRQAWAESGWERGPLGYPTSDEFHDGRFRRSNFEGGHILWAADTGARIVR